MGTECLRFSMDVVAKEVKHTYAYKVLNFERPFGLKDLFLSSFLQCSDSVVKVSYVFQMCPVFVQSGFECV